MVVGIIVKNKNLLTEQDIKNEYCNEYCEFLKDLKKIREKVEKGDYSDFILVKD